MKRMKTRLNDVMEQSTVSEGVVNGSYHSNEGDSQLSTPQITSRAFKSELQFSQAPEGRVKRIFSNILCFFHADFG